jgi:hypothetical protein
VTESKKTPIQGNDGHPRKRKMNGGEHEAVQEDGELPLVFVPLRHHSLALRHHDDYIPGGRRPSLPDDVKLPGRALSFSGEALR